MTDERPRIPVTYTLTDEETGDSLGYAKVMPARAEGERVTITFTLHDSTGRPSYDQIRIQVDNAPSS